MPSTPLTPEKRAETQALAQAIREATAAEIETLAETLITSDDQHLFGQNEFHVRALAHKIAAKAFEQHLAQKKRLRRRCAYLEWDTTGVRIQGEGGEAAEGRMAYVGMVCNP